MDKNKNKLKKQEPRKVVPPQPPLKPKHPNTTGAPDDNDPNAQYEEKDGS